LKPQLEEIGTQRLINDTLATIQTSNSIEVSTTIEQDCTTITADPTMMKRILTNLITNASQAMPNGGKLTIAAFKKHKEVNISVQDTGQGIPDELIEAAKIDGASNFQVFWHVTVPMLTPVIFFQLILGLISALQMLTIPWLATTDSVIAVPPRGIHLYMIYIYEQIFSTQRFGYGMAILWLLIIVVFFLTFLILSESTDFADSSKYFACSIFVFSEIFSNVPSKIRGWGGETLSAGAKSKQRSLEVVLALLIASSTIRSI
jgi:hypothetical protein